MSEIQNDGDRAELRKKRRKKERIQALAIMGAAAALLIILVVLLISGMVRVFGGKKEPAKDQIAQAESSDPGKDQKPEKTEPKPEPKPVKEEPDAKPETEEKEEPDDHQDMSVSENEADLDIDEQEASEEDDADSSLTASLTDEEIEESIAQDVAAMTLEQKVSRLFIVTPGQLIGTEIEPKDVGSQFSEKISNYPVSGILLKKANIGNADEFASMISNLKLMMGRDTLLIVDDEGGENSPFISTGLSENVIASEHEIGESLGNAGAYSAGISIGGELKNYGINVDLAPNVDVSSLPGSAASSAGFGKDAATNTELAKNMIRGLKDQGILCVVKSFPGYGDVTGDGSGGKLSSNKSRQELIDGATPYMECLKTGADMLMISHVGYPKIRGDQRPASLSEEIITGIVREELGYDGIVITDYMDKSCIFTNYTYADAAVSAIEAGADIILSTKNFSKSYDGIMDAVKSGKLSEERINESVIRILRLCYRYQESR